MLKLVKKLFGRPNLSGKFILTDGTGGMSGAQPLARKMAKATILVAKVDRKRIERKIKEGYCNSLCESLDETLEKEKYYTKNKKPVSIGLVGNCTDIFQEIYDCGFIPDIVTD